jgi:glycosyltransferase involved in cell wall biosynthesis
MGAAIYMEKDGRGNHGKRSFCSKNVIQMKIGILGTRGIPNAYGGFEQFAEHLSIGLHERGHEVFVYNSSLHPYKEEEWNNVKIIHCRDLENKIGTAGQFIYDLNCIRDARIRGFDILLHLGYTSDSVWHLLWPEKAINIVNMDGLEWKRSKYTRFTQRFLKWGESLAARNAHTMIADSPDMQDYLLNTYGKKPIYIPYGADIFSRPEVSILKKYDLQPYQYFLMISRMEPENNIEMIIKGYLASNHSHPILIIGNITNKFGRYITATYKNPAIKFSDAIYDQAELDNLRYYCSLYFHGHSVGGTNPSLLEAMACGCRIAAHANQFNKAVLQNETDYFPSENDVTRIINAPKDLATINQWKKINIEKIRTIYNWEKIIDEYENLMLSVSGQAKLIIQPQVAKAV